MNESSVVRLSQRSRDLFEDVDDTFLRLWIIDVDELVQRGSFEELQGVIEDALRRREGSRSRVGCANDRPCKSTRYLLYEIALGLEPPTVVSARVSMLGDDARHHRDARAIEAIRDPVRDLLDVLRRGIALVGGLHVGVDEAAEVRDVLRRARARRPPRIRRAIRNRCAPSSDRVRILTIPA